MNASDWPALPRRGRGLAHDVHALAGALVFLFAIRLAAWVIAMMIVLFGDRDAVNTRFEPYLLLTTLVYILLATLYVPFLRPRVLSGFAKSWEPGRDLVILGLIDFALVFVLLYVSGGFNTPYYHYTNVSLVALTFLLGWRGSIAVAGLYLIGYLLMLFFVGAKTEGSWAHDDADALAGIFLTPVMVVLAAQFFGWLVRRMEEQREQARRAFYESSALFALAQSVEDSTTIGGLAHNVVEALRATSRFDQLAIYELRGQRAVLLAAHPPLANPVALDLGATDLSALDTDSMLTVDGRDLRTVVVQDRPWGFIDVRSAEMDDEMTQRLGTAMVRQFSLGVTKHLLNQEREQRAALEERARIAREIHDGIAQSIYMLSLNLDKAAELAPDEAFSERLRRLVALSKEALLEVRHYIFDLRPLLTGEANLLEALEGQIREFGTISGLDAHLSVSGVAPHVPIDVATSVFRISQEALANVFRHAEATKVDVSLGFDGGKLLLHVVDNGRGFKPGRPGGNGLTNMRRRAEALGGSCEVESAPGGGTSVRVALPIEEAWVDVRETDPAAVS